MAGARKRKKWSFSTRTPVSWLRGHQEAARRFMLYPLAILSNDLHCGPFSGNLEKPPRGVCSLSFWNWRLHTSFVFVRNSVGKVSSTIWSGMPRCAAPSWITLLSTNWFWFFLFLQGKFLMQVLELVAWKNEMRKVMLTIQRGNTGARSFYSQLSYILDDTDPGVCEPLDEVQLFFYFLSTINQSTLSC